MAQWLAGGDRKMGSDHLAEVSEQDPTVRIRELEERLAKLVEQGAAGDEDLETQLEAKLFRQEHRPFIVFSNFLRRHEYADDDPRRAGINASMGWMLIKQLLPGTVATATVSLAAIAGLLLSYGSLEELKTQNTRIVEQNELINTGNRAILEQNQFLQESNAVLREQFTVETTTTREAARVQYLETLYDRCSESDGSTCAPVSGRQPCTDSEWLDEFSGSACAYPARASGRSRTEALLRLIQLQDDPCSAPSARRQISPAFVWIANAVTRCTPLDLSGLPPSRTDHKLRIPDALLERANLAEAALAGADMRSARLAFASFVNASLVDVDLSNADLTNADLRGADLGGAVLTGVTLAGANLSVASVRVESGEGRRSHTNRPTSMSNADLRGADLRGANLEGAELYDADFSNANLRGASFAGARLHSAKFYGADVACADLTGAEGIENARGLVIPNENCDED